MQKLIDNSQQAEARSKETDKLIQDIKQTACRSLNNEYVEAKEIHIKYGL
jgi:hypothetical protein